MVEPATIDASPTKDFFISMLVKDIELVPAIVDLVDNSVDGMRRVRAEVPNQALWVRLEMSATEFRIQDNCGGIPIEIARDYAFRFGRPAGTPVTRHSVGQFGVGMKRALFKLGRLFLVSSRSATEYFEVEVDVDEWRNQPLDEPWQFQFSKLQTGLPEVPHDERGTTIRVTRLFDNVAADLDSETFQTRLRLDLQRQHQLMLGQGLAMTVNRVPVNPGELELLRGDVLRPGLQEYSLEGEGAPVTFRVSAGIGESKPREAGWYVFCNGRLVLAADRTPLTGWDWGRAIPKFHNQFARFRGYVFFDSDDAGRLPWTTTKTGVDENSGVYRSARLRMVEMMRPVIDFLNILDREKEGRATGDIGPLEQVLTEAKPVPVASIEVGTVFVGPKAPAGPRPPKTGRIQYSRPVSEIDKVKESLAVKTFKEVGERTFDYYLRMEVDD